MGIEIRCVYGSAESSAAVRQMDDTFGASFARFFEDKPVFQGFGNLCIFLSIRHPVSQWPDTRRGSYHKPTDTYFSSCQLDYADWIRPDWNTRVLGYGKAVNTAIMRIAKTRLTDAERLLLLDVNAQTIAQVLASPPEAVKPLESIWLTYSEEQERPAIGFGNMSLGLTRDARIIEVKPEDAFSAAASIPERKEALPSIPRLFRHDDNGLYFYEAFPHEGRIAEHEGICGEGGENRFHEYETPGQAAKIVSRLKFQAKARGYRSVSSSKQKRLIVEYPIMDGFANPDELDTRHALEEFLNNWLGRLGLGHCDGGSSGQGTMEVCCFVVDFNLAKAALEPILAESEFKAYTRIYLET